MATIDVSVRAASTFNRMKPTLGGMAWNRRTICPVHMPEYLETAIHDECTGSVGDEQWSRRTGVAVVIRVVS